MDALSEKMIELLNTHKPVETKEGWIDCECGWESNHPLLPTAEELAELEDPEVADPPHRTGEPDPEHLHNDGPFQEHLAALQVAALTEEATE